MNRIILYFIIVLITGCATSGYQKFYNPYVDVSALPSPEILQEGQEPKVYGTDNFERDIRTLKTKNMLPLDILHLTEDTKTIRMHRLKLSD